jgi:hypothetical protein
MTWDMYSTEIISIMVAVGIAGVTAMAAGFERRQDNSYAFKEPLTSLGLGLTYTVGSYGVSALQPFGLSSQLREFVLCLSYPLVLHVTYKVHSYKTKRRLSRESTPNPGLEARNGSMGSVYVSRSPQQYRNLIIEAEHSAKRIDRIPKRLSVLFKSGATIRFIAEQRFGEGSSNIEHYIEEHEERATQFYTNLRRGMRCRELYSMRDLIEYFRSGKHGDSVILAKGHLRDNLARWIDTIKLYPNYQVAITKERLPIKYEVINGEVVVIHEAIGRNDRGRLNALAVESRHAAREFIEDFDLIWDRIPAKDRRRDAILEWIEANLAEHVVEVEA